MYGLPPHDTHSKDETDMDMGCLRLALGTTKKSGTIFLALTSEIPICINEIPSQSSLD